MGRYNFPTHLLDYEDMRIYKTIAFEISLVEEN